MNSNFPYQSKELSWLSFNRSVLQEAADSSNPLYERIKFLAIYSSNLDEFYRVKVPALRKVAALKKSQRIEDIEPIQTLAKINEEVAKQQNEFGETWNNNIIPLLNENGIVLYQGGEISEKHKAETARYFKSRVLSYLQPVFISNTENENISLENRKLYLAVTLCNGTDKYEALVNIPSDVLPRFIVLSPIHEKQFVILLDEVIRLNLSLLFPGYAIESSHSIKLNRDEDISIEDEYSGDLVKKIRQQLEKRKNGTATRFLYDGSMSVEKRKMLKECFSLNESDMVAGGKYHNLFDLFKFPNPTNKKLTHDELKPLTVEKLERHESIFSCIDNGDCLLHYPYHSYEYVLRFFNEAAVDRNVTDIKVALYRISPSSPIANALISAAKNGKQVTVFTEVKARFDEANNLRWAEEMEKAGVHIIYSLPGLKVHAKVALVKRINSNGTKKQYGYFSTGNFNEATAQVYADEGLFTCENKLTREVDMLFAFLRTRRPNGSFNKLMVSQFNMKKKLLRLIDNEIINAKTGKPAKVTLKLNGIDDTQFIKKLYEASASGVEITIIARGICTIIPGVKGISSNIKTFRLVDRFLEHSRVMIFHNGGDEKIYLSSADWMSRNLNRRIEVAFPIYNPVLKNEIKHIISLQLNDNEKLRTIDGNMDNIKNEIQGEESRRAQLATYEWLKEKEQETNYVRKLIREALNIAV